MHQKIREMIIMHVLFVCVQYKVAAYYHQPNIVMFLIYIFQPEVEVGLIFAEKRRR